MKPTIDECTSNAATIRAIPATHISDEDRASLINRAIAGEDVYAYGLERIDSGGIANLWDIDTRIPLAPVSQHVWRLLRATLVDEDGCLWRLTFQHKATLETLQIQVTIHHRAIGDPCYTERAKRVATMIDQTIALYNKHPQDYHLGTF